MIKKFALGIAVMIAIAAVVGCGKDSPNQKSFAKEKISVKVEKIEILDLEETVRFSGRLEGRQDIMVFPQMPGTIEKILVKVGDNVPKGKLLVVMKGETLQQTRAQFNSAKQTYDRMKSLYQDSLIAPQSYDQARAGYLAAEAAYRQVLDNTELRAPFAGTIVGKYFNEHDVYAPGALGILRLAKTDQLKLPITIAAKDFRKLKAGMKARVTTEVFPDTTFEGTLENLSPGADPITGLFSGEIVLNNKDARLPVGVFVTTEVVVDVFANSMVIPRSAVVADSVVFIYDSGKVKSRVIESGLITSQIVEVKSGLESSDMVVTKGALGLKDGLEVYVIEEVAK